MSEQLDKLRIALGDRYEIDAEVGSGGMANVYRARDIRHQRNVALKVLRPELAATLGPDRFLQEVRVTANLQHPHILPLFDSGEADGFLYYVMPFVEGETLGARLEREGELPVPEAARILRDVVDGLATAHRMGVVHRDIKPDNILLSGRHAMIADFGVAKAVSEATGRNLVTTMGVAMGTPTYMAPEQAAADTNIDHRADIYAVGALAYQLLTGRPPFQGVSPQQVLVAHMTEQARPITELRAAVPPGLATLITRCLEKKPADRWQSAEEMLPHLEAVATPSGGVTPTQIQPVTVVMPLQRKSWLPWAGAAAVVVVAGLAMVIVPRMSGGDADRAVVAADTDNLDRLIVVPLQALGDEEELELFGQLAAEEIGRSVDQYQPIDRIPASAVRDASQRLGQEATVDDLARATGATHVLAGTVARIGGQLRFEIEILNQRTGELIRSLDPVSGPSDSVQVVIARVAQVAAGAAVSLLDPEAPAWMASTSLPPSVEVYRDRMEQNARFARGDNRGAIEMGAIISAKAPDYVPALATSYTSFYNRSEWEQADSVRALLTPLRGRMTTAERLNFDWVSAFRDGDPEAAMRAADELYRLNPGDSGGPGMTARRTGRLGDAVERLFGLERQWFGWRNDLAIAYHLLGRYEEELAFALAEFANYPDDQRLINVEARALVALGRIQEADSVVRRVAGLRLPSNRDPLTSPVLAALELRIHGYEVESEAMFEWVIPQHVAREPDNQYNRGLAYYYARRWEDADTVFASLRIVDAANETWMGAHGVILAKLGRRDEALAVSDRLAQIERSAGLGSRYGWQARIMAALGDRDGAVRRARLAFDNFWEYTIRLRRDPAFDGMRGYPPWEALIAPR